MSRLYLAGMNPIEALYADARAKRDRAIQKARAEYHLAIQDIRAIANKLRYEGTRKPKYRAFRRPVRATSHSCRELTVIAAVELILREGQPMTLIELTLEVQRRGCRTNDDPHAVHSAISSSLRYHRDKFVHDADKRWSVVE